MRRLVLVAVLLALAGCDKMKWKPPAEKEAPRTAIESGHRFETLELMAGPYLATESNGSFVLRYEVGGDGCGGAGLLLGAEELDPVVVGRRDAHGRLQGTVCQFVLPALPRCRELTYQLKPWFGHELTMRLPPAAGRNCPDGTTLLVLGDTRTGHDVHRAVVARAGQEEASFIINLGDIVQLNQRFFEWYQFFEIEKDLLSQAPVVVVPGNHETWWEVEFGALMLNRFFRVGESGGIGHHSLDLGRLHLVFLDVYWGEDLANEGLEWLRQDLSSVPEGTLPLVFLHEPPISFGAHRPRPEIAGLMPHFAELGVGAVIAGHAHLYEHFLVDGLHYVTAGGAGAHLHQPSLNVFGDQKHYLLNEAAEHHYLLLRVKDGAVGFEVKKPSGEILEQWEVALPVP